MATVNRVLPWRRNAAPPSEEVAPLVEIFQSHHPRSSAALITKAYDRAASAHKGQSRKSGEPYVTHPVAVAKICAELGLDDITIAAALLHDAVEDTGATLFDVEKEFGGNHRPFGLINGKWGFRNTVWINLIVRNFKIFIQGKKVW